jgi:hypothetical protein
MLTAVRESCARSLCTFPEESDHGDSIEVDRQESAPENDHHVEARVREREKRREDIARPEAQKLDEAQNPLQRHAEVRGEATQHTRCS